MKRPVPERIPEILARLARVEKDLADMQALWRSSVDDIKATIKAELAELKAEQIADLREAIKSRDRQMETFAMRLRHAENTIGDWNAGRKILAWFVKVLIGVAGVLAGYFGAKHAG
jgi:hypothetical protein